MIDCGRVGQCGTHFEDSAPLAILVTFYSGKTKTARKKVHRRAHMCRATCGHWPPTETHSKQASGAYEMVFGRTEPGGHSLAENDDHQFGVLLGSYGE